MLLTDKALTLRQIVPLYQTIESVIGERTVRSLPSNLTLDQNMRRSINHLFEKDRSIKKNLKDAICVFAHRYMSSDISKWDMHSYMIDHLDNKAYWTLENVSNLNGILEGFPKGIKLVHTQALYQFLQVTYF